MRYFGGIEAGGTKFVCSIADESSHIIHRHQVPTTSPEETMPQVIECFKQHNEKISALGVGTFGPADIHPSSKTYGYITHTPKLKWEMFDILGALKSELQVPMGFDTDVNVAALGEHTLGAAQGLTDFLYITVGTGVGVGGMAHGQLLRGLTHPEMGHILVRRSEKELDDFHGLCPYHQDCLEGMAAGPAINARWKVEHCSVLGKDHPAWELESDYLAQALLSFMLICSPQRIIMGGGVMKQTQMFPMIQEKTLKLLNGYIQHPAITESMDTFVVPPKLGDNAGSLGAIALAQQVFLGS